MTKPLWTRLGASLSFCALCLLALPALAQQGPLDVNTALGEALQAITNIRGGYVLVGLVGLVNLLTNLTKLSTVDSLIPNRARPFIALGLGVATALLGARATGVDWASAIATGITAGLGSIAFHEVVQGFKPQGGPSASPSVNGFAHPRLLAIVTVLGLALGAGCAYFRSSTAKDLEQCGEATLAAEAQLLLPTVVGILEGGAADWPDQLVKLEATVGSGVICAVHAVVSDFNVNGWPDAGSPPDAGTAVALASPAGMRSVGMQQQMTRAPVAPVSEAAKARGSLYLKRR